MAVHRVHKTKDYTVLSNYHLKDKQMTLKTKGLLSLMLSLPDDWDYSIAGLAAIIKDGQAAVRAGLKELEELGYLKRTPVKENGIIREWAYDIYEKPVVGFPQVEKPQVGKPQVENRMQLNTKEPSTKESNTKESNIGGKKRFTPPTLEEVKAYCLERNKGVDPERFMDYYTSNGWMVGKNKMKDWKAAVRTWEKNGYSKKEATNERYGAVVDHITDKIGTWL